MIASYLIVGAASLITAGLTLYSGFGLGTLLMPIFALFFPVEVAVAATAVVHAVNSLFKVMIIGSHADRSIVIRFGVPAIFAALAGASALGVVSGFGTVASYSLAGREAMITPIKLIMASLMLLFALFELLPRLRDLKFDRKYLFVGGILSGFFGGLSGHQGALRSAFLVKLGISTETFVGTNAMIGFLVDVARVSIYATTFLLIRKSGVFDASAWPLVGTAISGALVGVLVGKRFLRKVTMRSVQTFTGTLLLLIAFALGIGFI